MVSHRISARRKGSVSLFISAAWVATAAAAADDSPSSASSFAASSVADAPPTAAQSVTVTGRAAPLAASIASFGDMPINALPLQVNTLGSKLLQDSGVSELGQLTRMDASLNDAYNAPGYWASFSARGYALDNRFNVFRDGLPINAESAIALENKEGLELLKGTSGIQAGTSAPGGLLNLVVKRPRGNQRSVELGVTERGGAKVAADIDWRLGAEADSGLRLNLAAEQLSPAQRAAEGDRRLLAAAWQTRWSASRLLEAEIEISHQSQPSVPGFSLLGEKLPLASRVDPRINLNNQPWSQPVVFDGQTASLRWTEQLSPDWKLVAQALQQQLKTDDRLAFPYGCSAENTYDRYCSDGSFDLYDYRSEGERRTSRSQALKLEGSAQLGSWQHRLSTGLLHSSYRTAFPKQAYNWTGTGSIDGGTVTAAAPELTTDSTNLDESSTEWRLQDVVELSPASRLWLGLRRTDLQRASRNTDGSANPPYAQAFITPWLALTTQIQPTTQAYVSWGEGVESAAVPNRSVYANAGQTLPALKSRQWEIGLKHDGERGAWSLAAFDIRRPLAVDLGSCDTDASCTRAIDGAARHLGFEASSEARFGDWSLRGSALALKARREGASDSTQNGLTPTNVPERSLRLSASAPFSAFSPLSAAWVLQASVSHEGRRAVLPDDSVWLPGWTSWAVAARYSTAVSGAALTWRIGLDNLFDQRAWQESPYQYGHAYLYPLAPRSLRSSLTAQW